MRGRCHHTLQADSLAPAVQDRSRTDRELVAPVELRGDIRMVAGRPVSLAMEAQPGYPHPPTLLRQGDGALDVRAPVGVDDLAVLPPEMGERVAVRGGRQAGVAVAA